MAYPARRDSRSGGYDKGPKKFGENKPWERGTDSRGFERPQMHRAVCATCGNSCEVPFKPNGSKPIYCRDCFKKDGDMARPARFENRGFDRPNFAEKVMHDAVCDRCGQDCEVPFRPSGDRPVYCKPCLGKGDAAPVRTQAGVTPAANYAEEFKTLNAKLDAILKALAPAAAKKTETAVTEKKKPAKKKK